jgi:glycosyltransferase involved in cell wall biosynthesis
MIVSIIVPTYNRAHAILPCLNAIAVALSKAAHIESEIIVVNNASTDDTTIVVQSWAASNTVPLHLLFEPRQGLSYARNCGLRAAKGDLLVFTDDDCCMHPDYILQLLKYDANDAGPVLRGGCVVLGDPTDLPLTIKTRPAITRWSKKLNSARHENLGDTLLGCNMSMRKTVANLIGLFDELLGAGTGIPGAEDIDYVYRAYLAGVTIEFVPDMLVYHFHGRRQISDGTKLFQNYSMGGGALFAKYMFIAPSLCRPLYWDLKGLIRELRSGSNTFMPTMNFSYKNKFWWYLVGIKRYLLICLRWAK